MLLATGILLLFSVEDIGVALVSIASYLSILLVHELGHAWFARRERLEVLAIRIGFFHGNCEYEAPEYRRSEYRVAWGGVVFQFAVGIPVLVINAVFEIGRYEYVGQAVAILGFLNIVIAFVNLIPAQPLDGYLAWRLVTERERKPRGPRGRRGKLRSIR